MIEELTRSRFCNKPGVDREDVRIAVDLRQITAIEDEGGGEVGLYVGGAPTFFVTANYEYILGRWRQALTVVGE